MISKRYGLDPNQISDRKKQFLESATAVFETGSKPIKVSQEPDTALFYD